MKGQRPPYRTNVPVSHSGQSECAGDKCYNLSESQFPQALTELLGVSGCKKNHTKQKNLLNQNIPKDRALKFYLHKKIDWESNNSP